MATVPVYIICGDFVGPEGRASTVDLAVTAADPPSVASIISNWNFQFAGGERRYDFPSRILGVAGGGTTNLRFPADPSGFSYAPLVWCQDGTTIAQSNISGITTGAVTTITLSIAHGRVAGKTAEVQITGVTGADAASINGTRVATFRSTNQIELAIDSSAMTLVATGVVKRPAWYFYSDTLAAPIYRTMDADPTTGGFVGTTTDQVLQWGYDVSLIANIHDFHGARGELAYVFLYSRAAPLAGRDEKNVSAATNAAEAVLTVTAHGGPKDAAKPFPVTVHGLSGAWAGLNGPQQAVYVTDDTIRIVGANSTGWGSYPGGGKILVTQRMSKRYGEVFDDMMARYGEAIEGIRDRGDTPYLAGVFASYGRQDALLAQGVVTRTTGLSVSAIQTGFPTVLTLTGATNYSAAPSGKALLSGEIIGSTAALNGRHDIIVTSASEVQVLTETSGTIAATGVTLSIGEPTNWFREDVYDLVQDIRTDAAAFTSTPTANVAVSFGPPRVSSSTSWDGVAAAVTPQASTRIANGMGALDAPAAKIGTWRTDDLGFLVGQSDILSRTSLIDGGYRAWSRFRNLADGNPPRTRSVPCYVLIGDSYALATHNYLVAALNGDKNFNGRHGADRGIKVFNIGTKTNPEYTGVDYSNPVLPQPGNANTHPIFGGGDAVGPEQTLFLERKKAHPASNVYWLKLAVSGSAITDVVDTFGIATVEERVEEGSEERFAIIGLASGIQHSRSDLSQSFVVTLAGMSGIGIPDGSYTASAEDINRIRVPLVSAMTGSYAGNGGSIGVPRWDWRKSKDDLWPYLERLRDDWWASLEAEGYYPDVRGVFVCLGTNDALFAPSVTAWQADATQFVTDLRALFQTRSSPSPALPVVWQRLRSNPNYPGGADTQAKAAVIQSAQAAMAAADPAFSIANLDSTNEADIEVTRVPIADDDVHLTWEGTLEMGKLLENAYQTVDVSCAAVPSSESGSGSSSPSEDFVG